MADATPAAPEADATPAPEAAPEPDLADAGKKALDEERKARRDAEKRLKEQTAEIEKLRQQSMSDQEKAIELARAEGRAEAFTLAGVKLAAAEIRAASAGRFTDEQMATLTEGLNLTAFLDADGEVDLAKIERFVEGIAPKQEEPAQPIFPDLGQGQRGGDLPLNGDPLLNAVRDRLNIKR